ncbi:MAG: hypothetical protein IT221_05370 [Fluviicola sp.]|nr:hypothetical protein [Fluviicola sp.]
MTRKLRLFTFISLLALTGNLVCTILVSLSDDYKELSLSLTEEETEGDSETENDSNPESEKRFDLLEEEMELNEHFISIEFFQKTNKTKRVFESNYLAFKTRSHHYIIDNPPEIC